MSKYYQGEVGSFNEQVRVSADFVHTVIESLVAGNKHVTLHGSVGRKATGEVVTEEDPTSIAFTTVTNETLTLNDVAGLADLTITFPTVVYGGPSVASEASAGNPTQFRVPFTAEVPTAMQA